MKSYKLTVVISILLATAVSCTFLKGPEFYPHDFLEIKAKTVKKNVVSVKINVAPESMWYSPGYRVKYEKDKILVHVEREQVSSNSNKAAIFEYNIIINNKNRLPIFYSDGTNIYKISPATTN